MFNFKENDEVYFEGRGEANQHLALVKDAMNVEILNINILKQERFRRIYLKIDSLLKDKVVTNWPNLLLNINSPEALLDFIENIGLLQYPQALEKLFHTLSALPFNEFKQFIEPLKPIDYHERPKRMLKRNPYTLGCKVTDTIITDKFEQLDKAIHILSPKTPIGTAVRIFTCEDWRQCTEKFYLGCMTIEFKCILDNSHHLFKYIKYADIERSGLFISNLGTPITASSLSSSNYEKTNNREIIEKILL